MPLEYRQTRLIVLVALAAVGCGGSKSPDGVSKNAGGRVPKVITVGSEVPYAPFEFGRPPYEGFDVDIVREIARRLHSRPHFVNTPFNTIFRDLGQRKFDMVAAGAVIMPIPGGNATFSSAYLPAELAVVVRRGSDVRSKTDLAGKAVGAQRGSPGAEYARNNTKAASVRTYDVISDALNALAAGQVDAVIHDYPVTRYEQRSRRNLVLIDTIGTDKSYGFAFPKGSTLKAKVNATLEALERDGTYARIYRKWFRDAPPQGFAPPSG